MDNKPDSDRVMRQAIARLKAILEEAKSKGDQEVIESEQIKSQVLARYRPVFEPENMPELTREDFLSFLQPKNNHHWSGLYRLQKFIVADMDLLRKALGILVDESRPIEERLTQLIPTSSGPMVPKLGRAVLTAILQVVYPDKYGVWNGTSETGMKKLGIWPSFERGAPFGNRYNTVNEVLHQVANRLELNLWTLDYLWWRIKHVEGSDDDTGDGDPVLGPGGEVVYQSFGLEKYLQEFMIDNWERIEHFNEWTLYEEDGEIVGAEYDTGEIGRIDLLAKHKVDPQWLVIELKRNQSSDQTVGQVLRYMGWVKKKLSEVNDSVHGLIICRAVDKRLEYALLSTSDIDLMQYEVDFRLRPVSR